MEQEQQIGLIFFSIVEVGWSSNFNLNIFLRLAGELASFNHPIRWQNCSQTVTSAGEKKLCFPMKKEFTAKKPTRQPLREKPSLAGQSRKAMLKHLIFDARLREGAYETPELYPQP